MTPENKVKTYSHGHSPFGKARSDDTGDPGTRGHWLSLRRKIHMEGFERGGIRRPSTVLDALRGMVEALQLVLGWR